ncbi:hypothetical protein VB734_02150 [Synechococcus sp. BA-124 BA4]|jgi:hypothetical protein|uniref:hypothetical protein n=1 Tax=unclassified Synechococcus TaxID=2626047 RepID=UPI0018CD6D82|nr:MULTISPECIES: hypothetical protein [unclassified Synechococcus]MEA5398843.1 hypothetical protein [Synechococcus sp. BA-124 BA4]QPN57577.1 hypothetical protein I1E95_05650 [Synechococcus sp. CBW1107]CAK6701771.1 hypothetical protein BBFGKLBO_03233 [Synechococcus sp. CBW1107]
MDLPPVRFEMLRLDLVPSPAPASCRPVPGADARSLTFSMVEAPPCRDPAAGLAIDEPLGWPPSRSSADDSWTLPPPPVPPRPAS